LGEVAKIVDGLLLFISPIRHSTRGGQRQQPVLLVLFIVVNNLFHFISHAQGAGLLSHDILAARRARGSSGRRRARESAADNLEII
jgi:hypothetical protein